MVVLPVKPSNKGFIVLLHHSLNLSNFESTLARFVLNYTSDYRVWDALISCLFSCTCVCAIYGQPVNYC